MGWISNGRTGIGAVRLDLSRLPNPEHDRDAPVEPWLNDEWIAEGQDQPSEHSNSPAAADHLGRVGERLAARRQVSPVVSYILMFRTIDGRKRTYTIGKHGSPWTPETARQEARRILREVVRGADPLADKIAGRKAITVAELCGQYLAEAEAGRLLTQRKIAKKESTLISDRGRIARHIVPLLGRMPVKVVRRDDVERFMHDIAAGKTATREKTKPRGLSIVRGGRGVAGRTVALLGAIFTYAVRRAFGSTIRCMGSSGSPKAGDSDV